MPQGVTACLVFDDNQDALESRVRQANETLSHLVGHKHIEFEGDGVQGFSRRGELLDAVIDYPNALVIADLHSPTYGNIGARIMRAIAQHPVYGQTTWRVIWSRYPFDAVTNALKPYIHAFAAYDAEAGAEYLADAVLHALPREGDARVFPASLPESKWSDRLTVVLEQLVGEVLAGDERIAPMLKRRAPTAEIESELARIENPKRRRKVSSFITAVKDNRDAATAEEARQIIMDEMAPVAVYQISDGIPPAECDAAAKYRAKLQGRTASHENYLALTWLTSEEDELLRVFLYLFGEFDRANSEVDRVTKIHAIIGSSFDDPDPVWERTANEFGFDTGDLAYAIWTLADVRMVR